MFSSKSAIILSNIFRFYLIFNLLFLFNQVVYSQNNEEEDLIDSLSEIVLHPHNDFKTASAYVDLSEILYVSNIDTVIPLCVKAIEITDNIFKNPTVKTQKERNTLLKIKALALNNIGYVYNNRGNISTALEYFIKGLKIREEIDDKGGIAESQNNIGTIYKNQGNIEKALEYYNKCLTLYIQIEDKNGEALVLGNIGGVYDQKADWNKALEYYNKSLKINEETDDKKGIADLLNNIGIIYSNFDSTNKALEYYNKSLKIREEIKDKEGIAISLFTIAKIEFDENRISNAKKYALKSLEISKQIGFPARIMNAADLLYKINIRQNDWENAFEMYELFIHMRDSISNDEIRKDALKKQLQYDYDKKAAEIKAEQDKKAAVAEEQNKRQQLFLWLIAAVAIAVTIIAVIIYRSLHVTRNQKKVIEIQKKEIEEKTKGITDSINYAKRIQQAKLPKLEEVYSCLPQSFILFKPKDIVSGDFYFFHKTPSSSQPIAVANCQLVFIAAADCTGHGVPGALMSMIGSERLEDAVSQTSDTSEILRQLNIGIKTSLRQSDSEESTRDGMDIALCSVEFPSPLERDGRVRLKYAGANRPLWIIRKGYTVIEETKATKKAIGGLTEDSQHFESHELKLQQGDSFYIFTDGFADQFSVENKKFMTKKFKEILLSIQDKSMEEQKLFLNEFIENWKGEVEQTDDILVIGVRV